MPKVSYDKIDIDPHSRNINSAVRATLGRRIVQKLVELDINQSELARRTGLGRDSISAYVRGRSVPSVRNLNKIAAALDVDSDWLVPSVHGVQETDASLNITAVPGGKTFLQVNRIVKPETALAVYKLLNEDVGLK